MVREILKKLRADSSATRMPVSLSRVTNWAVSMIGLCISCRSRIPQASKFCTKCGVPISSACSLCSFDNPPQAIFCGQCGNSLVTHPKSEVELRQLTVLFCDLVDSTELSESKEAEELREIIIGYQDCCTRVLEGFGGYIAHFFGDGVLAYFGYPTAYEQDAVRAVEASLSLIEKIGGLTISSETLKVRIGIHTGTVVIGSRRAAGRDQVLGETPNLAARLQMEAEPNAIVISHTTAQLVRGFFLLEKLSLRRLKGFSRETAMYKIKGIASGSSYIEAEGAFDQSPFVGRTHEMEIARQLWRRTHAGRMQVLEVVGEPGIGKSRFVSVLGDEIRQAGDVVLESRCSPYHQNSALHPFIALLQREFRFSRGDSKDEKREKLEHSLSILGISLDKALPILSLLLDIPPDRDLSRNMTPRRKRDLTLQMFCTLLVARATQCPTSLILEDLQWADPSTLELIEKLVQSEDTSPILLLLTYRPDFASSRIKNLKANRLELTRLSDEHSRTIIRHIVGKTAPETIEHVVARSEGVPLFVEEIAKTVVESSALTEMDDTYPIKRPVPTGLIPNTVLDSITARFDRLGDAVHVAQLAAALGREFSYEQLRSVSSQSQIQLRLALDKLQHAQLIFCATSSPEPAYTFKHAIIRDAAYRSLLKNKRQQIHQRIAQVLEKEFPETEQTQPELLAYHYQEAAVNVKAISYWQRAGQRAVEQSANNEAIVHFQRGLELVKNLPDHTERTQKELSLQISVGAPLVMTKGYGAPEVEKAYGRARELCRELGEARQLFTALRGLWAFYLVRAEYRIAHELGGQLLTIAEADQNSSFQMEAQMALGIPLFYLPDILQCRTHLDRAVAIYDPDRHRSHALLYGQDPGIATQGFRAWMLGLLGHKDQAIKTIETALQVAQTQSHPFTLACALHFAAIIYQLYCEPESTQERAEAEIAISTEQAFPLFLGGGTAFKGWVLVEKGQKEDGIAMMQHGIATWHGTGAKLARTYWLALLAEAYGKIGQPEDGLSLLREAFLVMHQNEEHFYEAELNRIQGDLLLQSNAPKLKAEACYQQALSVAREQGAKILEDRALSGLCRLWKQRGRKKKLESG